MVVNPGGTGSGVTIAGYREPSRFRKADAHPAVSAIATKGSPTRHGESTPS